MVFNLDLTYGTVWKKHTRAFALQQFAENMHVYSTVATDCLNTSTYGWINAAEIHTCWDSGEAHVVKRN